MTKETSSAPYPYEIEYKGRVIRCRTVEDMQKAMDKLKTGTFLREETPWTEDEFRKLTGRILIVQRRLLAELLKVGTDAWMEDAKLRERLDVADNHALGGTLSGISKVAQSFGIEPRRIVTIDRFYQHAKPRYRYQITAGFAEAAKKHKWPSKDDLKDR